MWGSRRGLTETAEEKDAWSLQVKVKAFQCKGVWTYERRPDHFSQL